jgi:hypothetical protein
MKHTEGKIHAVNYAGTWTIQDGEMYSDNWILDSDMVGEERSEANANRLIKCWNMHDELVSAIKRAVEISDLWTFDKDTTIEHEEEAKALYSMRLEFDRLIKKNEQQ